MCPILLDPSLAAQQADQSDLVRRKLEMDSLRKRLGDSTTKEEKLRESCEGFEAIFLQKMWEQMRKTVPKEGFLHSKDEEAYQSLFDVELCKKMAGAGGIGLADMLYTQLSQQLENSGRTTRPSAYKGPLDAPATAPSGEQAQAPAQRAALAAATPEQRPGKTGQASDKKLTVEELYSPLPEHSESGTVGKEPAVDLVQGALNEFRTDLGLAARETGSSALSAEILAQAEAKNTKKSALPGQNGIIPPAPAHRLENSTKATEKGNVVGNAAPGSGNSGAATAAAAQSPPVEAPQAEPGIRIFGRDKKRMKSPKTAAMEKTVPAQPRGMAPEETLWPLSGSGGAITNHFGWEDDKASGERRWNAGIRIAAPEQTPVRAVLDGTVVYAGQREGYGHTVVLEHKNGFRSYYSNLESENLKVGDKVAHGSEFAKIATQPAASGQGANSASLLFELKRGEMAINPENAIRRNEEGSGRNIISVKK